MQADIVVLPGDGIGPEVTAAAVEVLRAVAERYGHRFQFQQHLIGGAAIDATGTPLPPETLEAAQSADAVLLGAVGGPKWSDPNAKVRPEQGLLGIRKALGLYANLRPCVAYHPFIATRHPAMDVVIVRENEEDTYAGIEHRQTDQVYQCLKLISRPGSEKIVRYAFEYARRNKRKKVTCFMKDNIMKMTDGVFHEAFDTIGAEYPDIEKEAWIVDIGAAKLADTPTAFDVIVMPNLYGDILSDLCAGLVGGLGVVPGANVGRKGDLPVEHVPLGVGVVDARAAAPVGVEVHAQRGRAVLLVDAEAPLARAALPAGQLGGVPDVVVLVDELDVGSHGGPPAGLGRR